VDVVDSGKKSKSGSKYYLLYKSLSCSVSCVSCLFLHFLLFLIWFLGHHCSFYNAKLITEIVEVKIQHLIMNTAMNVGVP
jgi:hypothetical protein